MKNLHCVVDDDFPCGKIEAFKVLCLKEGDYKTDTGNQSIGKGYSGRGLYQDG